MLAPSGRVIPPLKRIDLARFKQVIEGMASQTQVLLPEMFRTYDLRGNAHQVKVPGT
jgi:hypothetical protein